MQVLSAFQQIWRRKIVLLLCYSVLELLSYIRFLWRAQKLVRHHTLLPPHLEIPKFTSFFISRLRREVTNGNSSLTFWFIDSLSLTHLHTVLLTY